MPREYEGDVVMHLNPIDDTGQPDFSRSVVLTGHREQIALAFKEWLDDEAKVGEDYDALIEVKS